MPRAIEHHPPDLTLSKAERDADRLAAAARRSALNDLIALEADLREQANGSQDGYLLDAANRIRKAIFNL